MKIKVVPPESRTKFPTASYCLGLKIRCYRVAGWTFVNIRVCISNAFIVASLLTLELI